MTKEVFVPLYISNECDAFCSICNLRSCNDGVKRRSATIEKIIDQLDIIKNVEMIDEVCILTGELVGEKRTANLYKVIEVINAAIEKGFKKVLFNIGSLDKSEIVLIKENVTDYKKVVLSLFQETYNKEVYKKFFGSRTSINPKADYDKRLETPRLFLEAGFKSVDLGILVGLTDIDSEVQSLIDHIRTLKNKYDAEIYISLPRIIGVNGFEISDTKYTDIVKRIKSEIPFGKIIITTREKTDLMKKVIDYVSVVSPGSSDITPYRRDGKVLNFAETSQFQVSKYRQSPSQILKELGVSKNE